MTKKNKILIIGGYGDIGALVTRELHDITDKNIIVAGRNKEKAIKFSKTFTNRVSGRYADAFDKKSLLNAMSGAAITINCTGPSNVIKHRVAEAAVESKCHYVDPGGYKDVTTLLRKHNNMLINNRITLCTSAGLLPGYVGIMARNACNVLDSVDSIEMYYIFKDAVSYGTAKDIVLEFKNMKIGKYSKNRWKDLFLIPNFRFYSFPHKFGTRPCVPIQLFEFEDFPQFYNLHNFSFNIASGSLLLGAFTVLIMNLNKMFKSEALIDRASKIVHYLCNKSVHKGTIGFSLKILAKGRRDGKKVMLEIDSTHKDTLFATALPVATIASMILDGEIDSYGCFYLNECADPTLFLKKLNERGFSYNTILKSM